MKKFKLVLLLLVVGFIVLLVYQNQSFFLTQQTLTIDPYIADSYQTPSLYNAIWFLVCFVVGILVAYGFGLPGRFRQKRVAREMREKMAAQQEMIDTLKQELERLQPVSTSAVSESDEMPEETDPRSDAPPPSETV